MSIFLNNLFGQNKFTDNLFINSNYAIGYILPEYQFLNYVVSDYARSYELSFTKETSGKNEWEQLYNFPGYGLRFLYSDLGSPEILGKLYGLYPYFNITFLNLKKFKIIIKLILY